MSKLPNAPLQEVIFELRWKINNKLDLENFQFISSDIYSALKTKYPFRKSINSQEIPLEVLINAPVFRYRLAENDYPLIQIGPGVLTYNSNDEKYFWENTLVDIEELLRVFESSNPEGETKEYLTNLIYIDFFAFNYSDSNILEFVHKNLNLTVNQNYIDQSNVPSNFGLNLDYIVDLGTTSINLRRGKQNDQEGLVVQTRIAGKHQRLNVVEIISWLNNAHDFCSDLFKKMTKGDLYDSFKIKN